MQLAFADIDLSGGDLTGESGGDIYLTEYVDPEGYVMAGPDVLALSFEDAHEKLVRLEIAMLALGFEWFFSGIKVVGKQS